MEVAGLTLTDRKLLCSGSQDAAAEEHGPAGEAAVPLLLLHHRSAPPPPPSAPVCLWAESHPALLPGVIMLVGWLQGKSILDMFTIGVR